jgi:hypothetical protein
VAARLGSLFNYIDLEARIDPHHQLRMIRMIVNDGLAALAGDFRRCIRGYDGPRSRRRSCCELAAASVLFDPLGATVDG